MDNVQGMNLLMKASEGKETKDSTAKKLFSRKEILTVILKYVVPEYADSTLEEIMDCIEGDTMLVGTAMVSPDMANTIRGETQESQPEGEALSVYDILFRSLVPAMNDEITVNLHIDLELQKNGKPGYPIENRGLYYGCRRFCSQIQKVSKDDPAYGKLEKVYSIWIIFDKVRKKDRDSISWHRMENYRTEGKIQKKNVDLLEVILIRLGGKDRKNKLLDFLYAITNGEKEKAFSYMPKMSVMKEMEVNEMFSLTEFAEEQGMKKGLKKGIKKGITKGELKNTISLIVKKYNKGKSFAQIADEMEMEEEELRPYYDIVVKNAPDLDIDRLLLQAEKEKIE